MVDLPPSVVSICVSSLHERCSSTSSVSSGLSCEYRGVSSPLHNGYRLEVCLLLGVFVFSPNVDRLNLSSSYTSSVRFPEPCFNIFCQDCPRMELRGVGPFAFPMVVFLPSPNSCTTKESRRRNCIVGSSCIFGCKGYRTAQALTDCVPGDCYACGRGCGGGVLLCSSACAPPRPRLMCGVPPVMNGSAKGAMAVVASMQSASSLELLVLELKTLVLHFFCPFSSSFSNKPKIRNFQLEFAFNLLGGEAGGMEAPGGSRNAGSAPEGAVRQVLQGEEGSPCTAGHCRFPSRCLGVHAGPFITGRARCLLATSSSRRDVMGLAHGMFWSTVVFESKGALWACVLPPIGIGRLGTGDRVLWDGGWLAPLRRGARDVVSSSAGCAVHNGRGKLHGLGAVSGHCCREIRWQSRVPPPLKGHGFELLLVSKPRVPICWCLSLGPMTAAPAALLTV